MNIMNNMFNLWNNFFNNKKKKNKQAVEPTPKPKPIILIEPEPTPKPIILKKDFSAVAGKGAYLYDLNPLYTEFGSSVGIATWLKSLGMDNVWMRIVGKAGWSSTQTKTQAKNLIRECNEIGIKVGAWGYLYTSNPELYASYVVRFMKELNLNTFIHNCEIEWEQSGSKNAAIRYWKVINDELPSNIVHGLSTFWNAEVHPNFPWDIFMDNIAVQCPQIYHVVKEPISILKKGIIINAKFNKPIVVTGQFFYNEMGITEQSATEDVMAICQKWNIDLKDVVLNNNVIGFNHWYCGGKGARAFNKTMRKEYLNFNPILTDFII